MTLQSPEFYADRRREAEAMVERDPAKAAWWRRMAEKARKYERWARKYEREAQR